MLNNTLVLINQNNYYNNLYIDGQNIAFYNMNDLNTLVEKTHFYLNNEYERSLIEKGAYETTKQFNTWKNRAQETLEIYDGVIKIKN